MNSRDRAVLFILFAGFATLVLDVRYEHRFLLHDTKVWQTWIPIVYAALAALASIIGMVGKKWAKGIAATVFFLGLGVGGYGLFLHTNFDPLKFQKFVNPDAKVFTGEKDEDGEPIEVRLQQPLAAPMSMAGLAAIGFVVTSGIFKSKKST